MLFYPEETKNTAATNAGLSMRPVQLCFCRQARRQINHAKVSQEFFLKTQNRLAL